MVELRREFHSIKLAALTLIIIEYKDNPEQPIF